MVRGTSPYSANFTPLTTPLTAITGTTLLTCQSNRFKDNSVNKFAVTAVGTPEVTKFSPYVPEAYKASTYGGSFTILGGGGPSNHIYTNKSHSISGDFTFECWVYLNSSGRHALLGEPSGWTFSSGNGFCIFDNLGSGAVKGISLAKSPVNYPGVGALCYTGQYPTLKTWAHIAISRSGKAVSIFMNGIKGTNIMQPMEAQYRVSEWVTEGSIDTNLLFNPYIGYFDWAGNVTWMRAGFDGHISDMRLINGTGIYTSNFTPPTAPLTAITNTALLLSGTNAGIIDSTANTDLVTIGSAQVDTTVKMNGTGSIKFNGTTDYLIAPYSSEFLLFTYPADYTIEACIVPVVSSGQRCIIASYPPGAGVAGNWIIWLNSASKLSFYQYPSVNETLISSLAIPYDVKTHFAVVRASGVTKLYINGVLNSTITTAYDMQNVGNPITIGAYAASEFFKGNISDIKISKTANYTANFTPPTNSF